MDNKVLEFIDTFVGYRGEDKQGIIHSLSKHGYCWHYYFALILKSVFNRGELYLTAPFGRTVWKDVDGVAYDISGYMKAM